MTAVTSKEWYIDDDDDNDDDKGPVPVKYNKEINMEKAV